MFEIKQPVIIDIYYDEYPVDFTGVDIAILKASGKDAWGTRYVDSKVFEYAGECFIRGIKIGLYHFLRPRNIAEQAAMYLEVWDALGSDLPPIVDVEVNPLLVAVGYATWASHIKTWLDLVEAHTGRKPMIYTSQYFWGFTGNPSWANDYPLWVAFYPDYPDDFDAPIITRIPGNWQKWALWQYAEDGRSCGHRANDYNLAAKWWLAELGEPTPPITPPVIPPNGDTMTYSYTSQYNMSLRPAPHTSNDAQSQLAAGVTVFGDELHVYTEPFLTSMIGDKWLHVKEIAGSPVDYWVAVIHAGKVYGTLMGEGEPPSDEYILHVKDGVTRKFVPE